MNAMAPIPGDIDLLVLLITLSLLIITIIIFKHNSFPSKARPPLPPGPYPWPIVGNMFQLSKKTPHITLANLAQVHGPLMMLKVGARPLIVGSSPAAAKEILVTHDRVLSGRCVPHPIQVQGSILHNLALVVSDECDDGWKRVRTIYRTQLLSTTALESQVKLREKKVVEMVKYLGGSKEGQVVSIRDVVFSCALNIVSNAVFSMDFVDFEGKGVGEGMNEYIRGFAELCASPQLVDMYPILGGWDFQRMYKNVMNIFQKICAAWVDIVKERRNKRYDDDSPSHQDFTHALISTGLTDEQINPMLQMSRPRPPSKALVPSSSKPNQLIVPPPLESIKPSSSIDIINRYQTLGTIHRPDYSSALANDPFASSQSVSVTPLPINQVRPSRTEYIKSHVANLFYKEPSHPRSQTINEIAQFHSGSGCHFISSPPEKNLSYYKDILLNHHSILIKPIQDRVYAYKILYHSLYIHNIVSLAEWGNPNLLRDLPGHSIQYNYHDYIDAWFKLFLYQNESFSHSWFISFDQKFKSELPTWFLRWWTHYGPISDILPSSLNETIVYFAAVYPFTTHQKQFPILLNFISKYKIPWIFKWHYGINDNIIIRQHSVKWWAKFNVPRIIEIVYEEFPPDSCAPTPAIVKAQQAQQTPTAVISQGSQPSLPPVNLGSPSSSGSKPKSSKIKSKGKSKVPRVPDQPKSKSKSQAQSSIQPPAQPIVQPGSTSDQLLQMARLLVDQAQAQLKNEQSPAPAQQSSSEDSSDSSEGSTNQPGYDRPEFHDAQDPFA